MPEEEYGWLPREKLLSFEEISELAGIFTEVGIEKVRLTGGEPLLRFAGAEPANQGPSFDHQRRLSAHA